MAQYFLPAIFWMLVIRITGNMDVYAHHEKVSVIHYRAFEADPEVRNKFWVILRVNTIIKESYKNAHKNNMNISKLVYVLTYSVPRCRYTEGLY